MGCFNYTMELAKSREGPFIKIEAAFDTGAYYSYLPKSIVDSLGIEASGRRRLGLADGTLIERNIGDAWVRINDEVHATVCVLGDEDADALLGAVTLEEFSLSADPVNERLVPMEKLPMLWLSGSKGVGI